jgi:hypothetical protein
VRTHCLDCYLLSKNKIDCEVSTFHLYRLIQGMYNCRGGMQSVHVSGSLLLLLSLVLLPRQEVTELLELELGAKSPFGLN